MVLDNKCTACRLISGSHKVDDMLFTLFASVSTLEHWLKQVDTEGLLQSTLIQADDRDGYKRFVQTTLVGEKDNQRPLPTPITLSQVSHQHELVMRVIQRALRRGGQENNVLAHGFCWASDNPRAFLTAVCNIECRFPNSSVSRVQTPVWNTLLTRVGDQLMSHLLGNTSVFMLMARPAVYQQVAGEPVYQLGPGSRGSTLRLKSRKHTCSVSSRRSNRDRSKQGIEDQSKPGNKNQLKPASENQSKPGSKNQPQQAYKNPPKPGNKNQPKLGNKNQTKPGNKNQPKPGNQNQPQLANKNQPKFGSKNQPKSGSKIKSKPGNKNQPKPGNKNQPKPGNKNYSKPGNRNQSEQGNWVQSTQSNLVQSTEGNRVESTQGNLVQSRQGNRVQSTQGRKRKGEFTNYTNQPEAKKSKTQNSSHQVKITEPTCSEQDPIPSCHQLEELRPSQLPAVQKPDVAVSDQRGVQQPANQLRGTRSSEAVTRGEKRKRKKKKSSCRNQPEKKKRRLQVPCSPDCVPYRKCKHIHFLNYYCPVKSESKLNRHHASQGSHKGEKRPGGQHSGRGRESLSTGRLLEDYVPHKQVFAFLKRVVRHTIPAELFGTAANMSLFLKNMKTLISSGKYEKLCLGQLMQGVKVKKCVDWLRGVTCHKEREHRMAQLLWWLAVHYVCVLIKTFFYLTDTSVYRNRVLYYRRKTWITLQARAIQKFRAQLQIISEARVSELVQGGRSLGVSAVRFLPKAKSLRPITNMSSKTREQKKSINSQLGNLFRALKFEKDVDPSICGSSAFGLDDIYVKLKKFKQDRNSWKDTRRVYCVKTDISKCFDSIQQHKLYTMITAILTQEEQQSYLTRKFATVHVAGRAVKRAFHSDTQRMSLCQGDLLAWVRQQASIGKFKDIILVDQALCRQETAESFLAGLHSHLFCNIIKMGGAHYLQRVGISQGSVISTLLASVYLAHLEEAHLSLQRDELLVCRMDDYLFVTPSLTRAQHFLQIMLKGFPDYNCFCNVDKVLTTFPVTLTTAPALQHTAPTDKFPWCGLLIDTTTLEVATDFSRYAGLCVRDLATFDVTYKPGKSILNKLISYLKIKCHAIFFDPKMNSVEWILMTAYQVFVFLARLFHSFVTRLPVALRTHSNPAFFCKTVLTLPTYMKTLVTRNLKQMKSPDSFPVSKLALQWLCAQAFLTKLHAYPGYKLLKKKLRAKRLILTKKLGRSVAPLRTASLTAAQPDCLLFDRHA